MKILHIWDSDYPWDVRVEKINDALIENRHEVFLVCRNKARKILKEHHRGILINRLPCLPPVFGKLNSIIGFPLFFSPLWKYYSLKVARENNVELIIVRDLPLVLLGLWVGKRMNIPVILDMAENYPYMLESILKYGNSNLLNRLIRNPLNARIIEKIAFKKLDKIFVVIEESRQRLLDLGVDAEKIEIICNTPPLVLADEKNDIPLPDDSFFKDDNRLVLLYNGLTNPARGLADFIDLLPRVLEKIPNIKLVINGKGEDDDKINNQIKNLKLENVVFHKGWVSHEDKYKYLAHCDVGLIPYKITSHWNTTIPNKLFDYMIMQKPVLSTDVKPTARIIHETNCGFVFNSNDLCEKLTKLSSVQIRSDLGLNGFKSIIDRYNWEIDKGKLINAIERRN